MALSIKGTIISFVTAVVFSALLHTTFGAPAIAPDVHTIQKRDASSGGTVEFTMPSDIFSSTSDYFNTADPILVKNVSDSKQAYNNDVRSCPSNVAEGIDVPVYKRSTCPWYYELEHDATRYPPTILKAKPLCRTCIGNSAMECVPITQTRTILKQGPKSTTDGSVKYTESDYTFEVGYTCAGTSTVANAATTTEMPPPPGSGGWAKKK